MFVLFCEDNDLVERRWLAGLPDAQGDGLAGGGGRAGAWIQTPPAGRTSAAAFGWLRSPGLARRWSTSTAPVWRWDVSADAAALLLSSLRRRNGRGRLVLMLDQPGLDAPFLANLYQA